MMKEVAPVSPGDLIKAAERLDSPDLERLVADLLARVAHRKTPALDQTETELPHKSAESPGAVALG